MAGPIDRHCRPERSVGSRGDLAWCGCVALVHRSASRVRSGQIVRIAAILQNAFTILAESRGAAAMVLLMRP
jgi:hypothetical protein